MDDAAFNGLSDIMSSSSGLMRAVDSADFQVSLSLSSSRGSTGVDENIAVRAHL